LLQPWTQPEKLFTYRIRRRMLDQHRTPIRVQLRAIFLESPGQGSLTLRIVRLFAGNVFAELKPALQCCRYITRLRRDGCTIRKQGKSC
jgi:hypothetical protein